MSNDILQTTKEDVVKCYKWYAPFYDWLFGKVLQPGRDAIAQEIKNIHPENILEIGVGTGLMLPLYPEKIHITGVDISQAMLDQAAEKIQLDYAEYISLMKIDGENLPFADHQFSCVVIPYTYSVTPNPEKLIFEARRVCKKNGFIVIVNHFSGINSRWKFLEKLAAPLAKKIGFHSHFPYDKYIESVDWKVLKSYSVNIFNLSKVVIISNG